MNPLAIALQGVSFGALALALQGFAAGAVVVPPEPTPISIIGAGWKQLRVPLQRSDAVPFLLLEDDDLVIAAVAALRALYESN